ncbi:MULTISPECIES: N-acetylglucosamine-6-phosphate deacetylase [unclassified Leptolyngbya]|uniref:N-acetylglucosamine-6-phosphate deacetylase n=1 Tax=unclassified Leptolyngbya TaxID=2650499 RepID=UPI00168458F6|nr:MULTISPECIES: N-acetylglucosamine-6-phosphate deacetylase [unclassified Leptolyngbya]MBD1913384.1 N-acetylglucosamine-6-phosphate deacetylase [Leptolyngbya sp. FACHB-8]MBD2158685.1 N-acetylglucosamine-6-phosphate deacetylase [Leptolyngbya sp. FACHB-16]
MNQYALVNGTFYTGMAIVRDRALVIAGDRIHSFSSLDALPANCPTIDLAGANVSPSFIDLQLNGCGGVMFNDAITAETLDIMHQTNLQSGTTSYLPTLITAGDKDMREAIALVSHYRQAHPYRVLGLHLEGPYLNPTRKGIHNGDFVRKPDWEMLEAIAAAGRETVKLVTLAPEQASAEQIQVLTEQGILVSAGHTDATYGEAIAGFDAGVRMATHLFNAMTPWQGRNPGMVGAVFCRPDVYAGIIADGHHVHFDSIRLSKQLKGEKLILVTDATPPVGTDMASFMIGGQEVFYRDGMCVSADGTLGGSALTMIEAVANCVHHVDIPLEEALRMATLYPARAIGVDGELGWIGEGAIANLAIFNDDLEIVGVVDGGQYLPERR